MRSPQPSSLAELTVQLMATPDIPAGCSRARQHAGFLHLVGLRCYCFAAQRGRLYLGYLFLVAEP